MLILSTFISCADDNRDNEKALLKVGRIQYFKDLVTGLCYAEVYRDNNSYSLTCVPCDSIKKIEEEKAKIIDKLQQK